MAKNRVLLSSVISPLGPRHGDGDAVGYELLHAQVTRAQGVFSPRAVHLQYGIEYIGANLDTPTVTLHYPTRDQYIHELETGGYSHVGIAFNLTTSHRMREMSQLVRRYAPSATIVLGGYGTLIPHDELAPYGDVICQGEGVAFMRDLLDEPERQPPFDHPLSVSRLKVLGVPVAKTGLIFGGLGCPNGCDFCCTSHYHRRKHIPLLPTGADLRRVVQGYQALDPEIEMTVLDEDFLLNKPRAMEFRDELMAHDLQPDMFVFASVKALSQYTPQELIECGVGGVWIGYEGTQSGYGKREGRPPHELFADLRRHGILILASMIIGQDYQTPEIVREEFEGLMALEPTLSQFLIYGPNPGTPLGERIEREGRFLPEYASDKEHRYRHSDGFSCLLDHPHMSAAEIESLQQECYEEDFRRLGPSIIRTGEYWQSAREYLTGRSEPSLARRARYLDGKMSRVHALFSVSKLLAPSPVARRRVESLQRRVLRTATLRDHASRLLFGTAAIPAAAIAGLGLRFDMGHEPRMVRQDWASSERPATVQLPRRCASIVEETELRLTG